MSYYIPVPKGWPWPMDGVQGWFESLAGGVDDAFNAVLTELSDTITPAIEDISTAVWNVLPEDLRNALDFIGDLAGQAWTLLWDFVEDPITYIKFGLISLVTTISTGLMEIGIALGAMASSVWAAIPEDIKTPILWLTELAGKTWDSLWDFVEDPLGSIQSGFDLLSLTVTSAFDGALSTFGGWVTDAMAAVAGALGSAIQGVVTWLGTEIPKAVGVVVDFAQAHIVDPIIEAFQWVFDRLAEIVESLIITIKDLFAHHSPITPEEALPIGIMAAVAAVASGGLATSLVDIISSKIFATGLELRAIGNYITQIINPGMFMGAVVGVLIGTGIRTPLTQFYNRLFRPNIPAIREAQRMLWRGKINMDQFRDIVARSGFGAPYEDGFVELTREIPPWRDLVTMAIREVFPPEDFYKYMPLHGFSVMWAEFYWEMHWRLPAFGNIIDAYHRGIITEDERDKYIVLHDFKPEPRPGIAVSDQKIMGGLTKRLIPRVDLRRGYRIGRLSREQLDERYGWLGYEEDAELQTDIQVGLAFEAERNKLRDNAKTDLVDGLITEDVLRADLATLDFSAEAIDYYVADAVADRERRHKKKLLDIYEDAYMKDLPTEPPFEDAVREILVDKEAADLFIEEAFIRKYKKPKAVVAG